MAFRLSLLALLITLVTSMPTPHDENHLDVISAGLVNRVGNWLGLPNPVHVAIYILVIMLLTIVMLILLCYGINCVYVMLFILLAICALALFLVVWYWIGIDPEDIPEFEVVRDLGDKVFNTTTLNISTTHEPEVQKLQVTPRPIQINELFYDQNGDIYSCGPCI